MNSDDLVWNHLSEVLGRFGEYFVNQAKDNLLKDDSNASGTLVNSITSSVFIDNEHYEVTVQLEDYWYYVNNGRKAGKFPPVEERQLEQYRNKIKEWIEVKPVKPQVYNGKLPTVDQLAFLIGRKIANEGTEGTGFFDKAKADTLSYFRESISNAINEDIGEYVANVLADYRIL